MAADSRKSSGEQQHGGTGTIRRRLIRRKGDLLTVPTPSTSSDDADESESQETEDEEQLPGGEDNGQVTFKEAIGGLFSSKTVQSTPHELILVKRYSHGKTFRQRLAYVFYKHQKTRLMVHYGGLFLNLMSCILYIAEAIYIDQLLITEDEILLGCFNRNITNYSQAAVVDLVLVPKHYILWVFQLTLALICLVGGFVAMYVHQEIYGSLSRHFLRHMTLSIVITLGIGMAFFCTVLEPQCLHILWIPSFLYCWPARHNFMYLVLQNSETSFFKSFRGFRTTAINLATFLLCFMFSCLCFIHHFERLGTRITLFDTFWFVVVTFSTVGYGDISPTHWTGKLIIIMFIVAALLYLPPKLDKLWRAFSLHRKHYKQYTKTPVTKHVVLAAVNIKPLVLRDFLNEIYSEPSQTDTQCVIMVEHEPADSIKSILAHPVWSQRIVILRGTALRSADLARAKLRTADACFLITSRDGLASEADQHTILSACTVKYYAPKCKLYVHIRLPQSKLQLNIAEEVICEDELTSAALALNSVCPGISTLAVLLMHTFTYEGRGFNNQDYKWYEKCSPVEIYHVKLGQSRYFHHFVGKNFLFTSVVAYRKFHVVLLGICPAGQSEIIFNPGIHHLLHSDDECYYISETKEERSDYQIVQPTNFQTSLWRTSATLGLLTLYMAGIDPSQIFHQSQECEEKDPDKKREFPRMTSFDRISKQISQTSLDGVPQTDGIIESTAFTGTGDSDDRGIEFKPSSTSFSAEDELDDQLAVEMTNFQHDVRLGLQLLKYHAEGEHPANKPCVKLSIVSKCAEDHHHHHHSNPRSQSLPSPTPADSYQGPPTLEVIPEDGPEVVVVGNGGDSSDDLQNHGHHHLKHHHHRHSQPALLHLGLPKRHSDHRHSESHLLHHSRGSGDDGRKKSFMSKLHSIPDTVSVASAATTNISVRSDKSTHSIDDIVVLQLDDISDVEELEDLEEGLQHEADGVFSPEEEVFDTVSSYGGSPQHHHKLHPSDQWLTPLNYVQGMVPTLAYCGCEPLQCHLMPEGRSFDEMKLDQTAVGTGISDQWHQHATIVYSDIVSTKLFHFVTPLRAAYLPASSLRPIVLMLGHMPDQHFLSIISQLPMVYFMIGTIHRVSDLLRAGIMVAKSLVVFAPNKLIHEDHREHFADADHITAIHKIARLFPHVKITLDVKFRYNIRFVYTTPFEELSLQKLRHMARKGDHLTYLFLPQVASARAFSSSMLDTLLYQSYQKPYIVNLFRQLLGCLQVKGSGFLWKVPVNADLAKLYSYVRVFQRLAASYSFVSMGLYRSALVDTSFDSHHQAKSYTPSELEKLRKFLIGELYSLGINHTVEELEKPAHQGFLYVNPPHDFHVLEGDIILGIRPPLSDKQQCTESFTPAKVPESPSRHVLRLATAYSAKSEAPDPSCNVRNFLDTPAVFRTGLFKINASPSSAKRSDSLKPVSSFVSENDDA